jgi:thiosulfate dehydrogenase [quinone] large subunit
LALAIAGHGDVLVPSQFVAVREGNPTRFAPATRRECRAAIAAGHRPPREATAPSSPERRLFLQTLALAAISAALASVTLPLRVAGLLVERPGPGTSPTPSVGGSDGLPSATSRNPVASGGFPVSTVSKVGRTGAATFTVPANAPASLPAGDPGVVVKLADGSFAAFDAVCTHAGCTVGWERADRLLVCPCHGAVFDPEYGAAVVRGPAPSPLTALPIVVDPASGQILLAPDS